MLKELLKFQNNEIDKSTRRNADRFYLPLLSALAIITIVLMYRQITAPIVPFDNSFFQLSLWYDIFGIMLFAFGMLLLIWQVSFALRYKAFALLPSEKLPTLTVVIPAYNEGSQVLDTVRSIMASNYPKDLLQVICVDDGSKDDTWLWINAAYNEFEGGITIIKQPYNQGKRAALMAGFDKATGDVIITIDSDSEVLPDTLANMASPFVADQRVGSVAGHVRVLNLKSGIIPKILEVSFTCAFDFIRAGQSVYGGVFCTPGALSAYRTSVLMPLLDEWSKQTFMGKPATIGEDRALTNLVLANGHRVVYQRDAVVLTKAPTNFGSLRRMLTRWARSNVRESLVMFNYVFKDFRKRGEGANWIRLFTVTQMIRMTVFEALKIALLTALVMYSINTFFAIILACVFASIMPSIVYYLRHRTTFGFRWALPYTLYWMFCLSWIPLWGMLTASNSNWLTRTMPNDKTPRTPFFPNLPTAFSKG
ncbi:MAG: glycosyltransferase [Emcibacteraceae bacterium]